MYKEALEEKVEGTPERVYKPIRRSTTKKAKVKICDECKLALNECSCPVVCTKCGNDIVDKSS